MYKIICILLVGINLGQSKTF